MSIHEELIQGHEAEVARLSTLQMMGFGTVGMGLLLILTGPNSGPSYAVLGALPGWPVLYGALVTTAGSALLWGAMTPHPKVARAAALSTALLYAGFSAVHVITFFLWARTVPHPENSPSMLQIAPYITLAALMLVQTNTMRQKERRARLADTNNARGGDG